MAASLGYPGPSMKEKGEQLTPDLQLLSCFLGVQYCTCLHGNTVSKNRAGPLLETIPEYPSYNVKSV